MADDYEDATRRASEVVSRCKARLEEAGYELDQIGDTIFIHFLEDSEAEGFDPRDEDEIEYLPFYDEKKKSFYRFQVHCEARFRKGWRLNKESGVHLSELDDKYINTRIDQSKPWVDELVRIIDEFVSADSGRALQNRTYNKAKVQRLEKERVEREERRIANEKEARRREVEATERKKRKLIAISVAAVACIVFLMII